MTAIQKFVSSSRDTTVRRQIVSDPTNAEVVSVYLAHLERRLKAGDVSAIHFKACKRDLNTFLQFQPADCKVAIAELTISESRNADLEDFLLSKPWSNAYRRRLRSEIVTCFTWAAREGGLIEKSPYYRSRALKLPVVPRRAATLREYVLLMRFGSRPLKLALMLLARSARTCEMRAVRWRDVDWENRVIELRQHKTSRSTGKSRLIGLDPVMYRLLRRRWERRKSDDEHIFTNSRGEPWTADSFSRNLRRTAKRLGLRVTGYMFRHLWASLAETRGLSDREIATGLGHTNTSLVHYYSKARCEKRHVRRIAEKVFAKRFG